MVEARNDHIAKQGQANNIYFFAIIFSFGRTVLIR
jgi:hypothetical protein